MQSWGPNFSILKLFQWVSNLDLNSQSDPKLILLGLMRDYPGHPKEASKQQIISNILNWSKTCKKKYTKSKVEAAISKRENDIRNCSSVKCKTNQAQKQ